MIVALTRPIPGLIVRYSYLWYQDHLEGHEDGEKDRPCAIVASVRVDAEGETRVLVLPITHSPQAPSRYAVEIPAVTKRRLGLDDEPSWVLLTQWNEFVWPGPDLRRLPGKGEVAYGVLPPGLFASIREKFLAAVSAGRAKRVACA